MQEQVEQSITIKRSQQAIYNGVRDLVLILLLTSVVPFWKGSWFWGCFLALFMPILLISMAWANLHSEMPEICTMNHLGITIKDEGFIPWTQIRDVWPEYYRGVCVIKLELETRQRIPLYASSLEMRPGDIVIEIKQRLLTYSPLYREYNKI